MRILIVDDEPAGFDHVELLARACAQVELAMTKRLAA